MDRTQFAPTGAVHRRQIAAFCAAAVVAPTSLTGRSASAQASTLLAALGSARFDAAVAALKADFAADPLLVERGQFYVTTRNQLQLFAQFGAALDVAPEINALGPLGKPAAVSAAMAGLSGLVQSANGKTLPADFERRIDLFLGPLGGRSGGLSRFFSRGDQPGAAAWSKASFDHVWGTTAIAPPNAANYAAPSIYKQHAAFDYEAQRCWDSSNAMASKLIARRALRRQAVIVNAGRIANVTAAGSAFTTVSYAPEAALAIEVGRIVTALNTPPGAVVRLGVLSGVNDQERRILGIQPTELPKPEHFVLLLAHELLGGTHCFLFWDPDAAVTNPKPGSWGFGFGVLFHQPGKFRTAYDDADDSRAQVNAADGKHVAHPMRKRYQVLSARSLPA